MTVGKKIYFLYKQELKYYSKYFDDGISLKKMYDGILLTNNNLSLKFFPAIKNVFFDANLILILYVVPHSSHVLSKICQFLCPCCIIFLFSILSKENP